MQADVTSNCRFSPRIRPLCEIEGPTHTARCTTCSTYPVCSSCTRLPTVGGSSSGLRPNKGEASLTAEEEGDKSAPEALSSVTSAVCCGRVIIHKPHRQCHCCSSPRLRCAGTGGAHLFLCVEGLLVQLEDHLSRRARSMLLVVDLQCEAYRGEATTRVSLRVRYVLYTPCVSYRKGWP